MAQLSKTTAVAVIGAGPAGLMAAEVLSQAGFSVAVFDAMPSVGRKFLRAGIGGLNLTHAEPFADFLSRYAERRELLCPLLEAFPPQALRDWAQGLGIDTFIGSSGRVFPTDMKAAPLLRAWLRRLREQGVSLAPRHRWQGWNAEGQLLLDSPDGPQSIQPAATLLALGGASWPQLGSDGAWVKLLSAEQIAIAPLRPANCGFEVEGWSPYLQQGFAGMPLKNISLSLAGQPARKGECILTQHGLEGSLIYALSAPIRQAIEDDGQALLQLDLLPDRSLAQVIAAVSQARGSQSLSSHLKRQLKLEGVKSALLHELTRPEQRQQPESFATALKHLPISLIRPRPLAEAISSAGGVPFEALDEQLMLRQRPGVFCAGEMLDWEAPTGGYLLSACFATGRAAGLGIQRWLQNHSGGDDHMGCFDQGGAGLTGR